MKKRLRNNSLICHLDYNVKRVGISAD